MKSKAAPQTSLFSELIVDNFAGGGGASTGIELATGRIVDIAINHDADAILMHKTNHPYTRHYQASVWDINPQEVCRGQKVGLAWFSPDCKHFSKAKGGKPADKKIRGLAWIVLRWAAMVRPRVIMLENVEEFQTWGPVRKGKPVKKLAGKTFARWKEQLQALGYVVEHRELRACDFGAPTIRKRFFLVARCDGKPIVWPTPTHADPESDAVKTGAMKPWRSAAEIIDWSLPCPSIFDTREQIKQKHGVSAVRPLAQNTLKRVARGTDKFVLKSAKPFLVAANHSGAEWHYCKDIDNVFSTITTKNGLGIVDPVLTPLHMHNHEHATGTNMADPINTVTASGGQMLVTPVITAIGQTGSAADRCRGADTPINTTVSKAETCLIAPALIQYHTEQTEKVRGQDVQQPIMTLDGSNRYAVAAAHLTEYYGNAQDGISPERPTHTATSKDREGLTMAYLSQFYSGGYSGAGATPERPLNTVTAVDHNALAAVHVSKFYGTATGQEAAAPLHTITQSSGHFGEVRTYLVQWDNAQQLHHWPEVRAMLNQFCGYSIADNEVLILEISGIPYFIADIGLRMLTPRELYNANGFPEDYIIDHDYMGNAYGKTKQVARCGNAVPPPFAVALVTANLPELCIKPCKNMEELNGTIAV